MIRTRFAVAGVAALLAVGLAGCQQPEIKLADILKVPPRPAELDRLEMFVGRWEGAGEMKLVASDEVGTTRGVETVSWDADKWLLVSRFEYTTGDSEDKMVGVGIWTWDAKAKKYRLWSFDSFASFDTATATYDETNKTWHFKAKSRNLATGETCVGEGTLKMPDSDTQEWDFAIWDRWKLRKFVEMKGTSRRK